MLFKERSWNAAGLLSGFLGVVILFFYGPPQPSFDEGDAIVAEGPIADKHRDEVRAERATYDRMSKLGLFLVGAGFAIQLWALYVGTKGASAKDYVSESPRVTEHAIRTRTQMQLAGRIMKIIFRYANAEFMLDRHPNGGGVIALRSFWISILVFVSALGVYSYLEPNSQLSFSIARFQYLAHEKFEWFGAIFLAAYLALYARFSSQWSYLGGLFNQITQSRVESLSEKDDSGDPVNEWAKSCCNSKKDEHYVIWMAAFVADAIAMHLARKEIFLACVESMLAIDGVEEAFLDADPGNRKDLADFRAWVAEHR